MNEFSILNNYLISSVGFSNSGDFKMIPASNYYAFIGNFSKEFIEYLYSKYQGVEYNYEFNNSYLTIIKGFKDMVDRVEVNSIEEVIVFVFEYYAKYKGIDRVNDIDKVIGLIYREILNYSVVVPHEDSSNELMSKVSELRKSLTPNLDNIEDYIKYINVYCNSNNRERYYKITNKRWFSENYTNIEYSEYNGNFMYGFTFFDGSETIMISDNSIEGRIGFNISSDLKNCYSFKYDDINKPIFDEVMDKAINMANELYRGSNSLGLKKEME